MVSRSFLNYCIDEMNDATNKLIANYNANNNKTTTSKSFEYKTKIIGSTPGNSYILDVEVAILLKKLSNFWRSLKLPLTNCRIEIDFTWLKHCAISEY